eukprot:767080-Hanusia_phi.AAC.1
MAAGVALGVDSARDAEAHLFSWGKVEGGGQMASKEESATEKKEERRRGGGGEEGRERGSEVSDGEAARERMEGAAVVRLRGNDKYEQRKFEEAKTLYLESLAMLQAIEEEEEERKKKDAEEEKKDGFKEEEEGETSALPPEGQDLIVSCLQNLAAACLKTRDPQILRLPPPSLLTLLSSSLHSALLPSSHLSLTLSQVILFSSQALQRQPLLPKALYRRALALSKLERWELCLQDLQQ